jgi:hypothetical protein
MFGHSSHAHICLNGIQFRCNANIESQLLLSYCLKYRYIILLLKNFVSKTKKYERIDFFDLYFLTNLYFERKNFQNMN